MGRRLWLILGILLLAPPALPSARAQGDGGPPASGPEPVSPADFPRPDRPIELTPPDDPAPPDGSPKSARPAKARAQGAGRDGDPAAGPAPGELPGLPAFTPAPSTDPSPARRRPRPRADAAVERTDAPAAADGEPGGAGRMPTGKQSVALTVEVVSPPSMNLHRPAKVRLIVHNTGASDALEVRIRDELPDGLKYVSSKPDATVEGTVLNWSRERLAAGKDEVIILEVEPVKTGTFEHGASVWFRTGSQARTQVFQPKLRIEQKASAEKVLKGHAVEFKMFVTNIGDGPARDVTVAAKLGGGLRHGSGERGGGEMVTEPIPVLGAGQTEELDPLVAEAFQAGPASCTVEARSKDVVVTDDAEAARSVATITVVEPRLEIALSGPEQRCTETIAPYEIVVRNPGTAPAKKVRVTALVPPNARLIALPKGAGYDSVSRRLQWSIEKLEPGAEPQPFRFEVKVGDVGKYPFEAEAYGDGRLRTEKQRLVTDVIGMADVDLLVSERQRVIDIGGKTVFFIRLHNDGTKAATNIRLSATITKNLEVLGSYEVPGYQMPADLQFLEKEEPDARHLVLQDKQGRGIKQLGPGATLITGIEVKVTGPEPKVAKCHVQVTHDELSDPFEDMASVKVLNPTRRAADVEKP